MKLALQQGIQSLGLEIKAEQEQQLLDYLAMIAKWNRVYNLTAVQELEQMLTYHLLDSLAVVQPLQRYVSQHGAKTLLDVGSGAGLPGVVFAICNANLHITCVDAVGKKAAFIQQTAAALNLSNLQGRHSRVENIQQQYDIVCSRAFASLSDFVNCSRHTLTTKGHWLAMKGKVPHEEISQLPAWVDPFQVEPLSVPALNAQRCIVWMRCNKE